MQRSSSVPVTLVVTLAALAFSGGCIGIFKVKRQPTSDPDSGVYLWHGEAKQVDELRASEPGELAAICEYWRNVETKAADDSRGMHTYARRRASQTCSEKEAYARAEAQRELEREAYEAKLAAATQAELESGTCSEDNRQLYGEWALYLKDAMRMRFTPDRQAKLFTFAGHELAVVGDSGTALQLSAGLGGELHLFAFGRREVELEVVAGGSQVALASPWEDKLTWRCEFDGTCTSHASPTRPDHTASQVVLTQVADTVAVRLRGSGCVLLVAFYGS